MGSYKVGGGSGNVPSKNTIEVQMTPLPTTATAVALQADDPGGFRQGTWYTVSMDSSVGNVQHGELTQATALASQSIDITAVDEDASLVMSTGLPGNCGGGSFPGNDSSDDPDAFCAWDFDPAQANKIRVQHSTAGGAADNDLTWQVIEWEVIAGAPATPRRVMVVS